MMHPSRKFIGSRLRDARKARAKTAVQLAGELGVSPQSISQYEKNKQSPSPRVIDRMCSVLRLPSHFFFSVGIQERDELVFWRSRSSATKQMRDAFDVQIRWIRDIVRFIEDRIVFPDTNVPDFDPPADPRKFKNEDIEDFASKTRRFWGLKDGPISNAVWLLEKNGIVVLRNHLGDERLDAFSQLQFPPESDRSFVILGTDRKSAGRSRHSLGHELAHLLLHRNVPPRTARLPEIHRLMEKQATRFSGAFMLPPTSFPQDVYSADPLSLVHLKQRWRISIAAMLMRLSDLDAIDEISKRRAFVKLSRMGWRKEEPLDDEIEPDEPDLICGALDVLLEQKIIDATMIESETHHYCEEIERLLGVDDGFFSDPPSSFKFRLREEGGLELEA